MENSKARSISAFFPCYNDKGTIASMVLDVKAVLEKITDDYEIIVIDDGSSDGSRELLFQLQREVSRLKLIFHEKNKGYGGALRSGFAAAAKELVFYTDGDGQYDVRELPLLLEKMDEDVDIVNGYKIKRNDPLHRILIGLIYQYFIKVVFNLKIKDVDCDFRLIRKRALEAVDLKSDTGTICIELVKKMEKAGFKFKEVGVRHFFRIYGKSQFFNFPRVFRTLVNIMKLWLEIFIFKNKAGKI